MRAMQETKIPLMTVLALAVAGISTLLLATPYPELALLPAPLLLFAASFTRIPRFWFYVVVFLIPYGAYRSFGPLGLLRLHWIIAFFLLAWVVLNHILERKSLSGFRSNLWPWILCFLAVNLIAASLSPYPVQSFTSLALMAVGFGFFALCLVLLSEEGFATTLPWVIIWSVSISSFLAVLGYVFNIPFFADVEGFKRGLGAVPDANNMSLMIIFTFPLLTYFLFSPGARGKKLLAIGLIGVNLAGLVVTYSRGGAIMFVVVAGLLAVVHLKRVRPVHLGILTSTLALAMAAAFALIPSSYWERQKSVTDQTDFSISRRASYLATGWEAFTSNPFLGAGPDSFRRIYSETEYSRRYATEGKSTFRHAHNTYLEVLVGSGLIGLVLFSGMLVRAGRNFMVSARWLAASGDPDGKSLVTAYGVSFLSLLLYLAIFSDVYHKYLLLSLAFSEVALRFARRRGRPHTGEP